MVIRNAHKIVVENSEGKDYVEDLLEANMNGDLAREFDSSDPNDKTVMKAAMYSLLQVIWAVSWAGDALKYIFPYSGSLIILYFISSNYFCYLGLLQIVECHNEHLKQGYPFHCISCTLFWTVCLFNVHVTALSASNVRVTNT